MQIINKFGAAILGPVVQGIEREFPKLQIQVRILAGPQGKGSVVQGIERKFPELQIRVRVPAEPLFY